MTSKRLHREEREKKVLFGLLELYIKTASPIGSQTLKENGFEDVSSATIRNYFSTLEKNGMLKQQHASGGRVPTSQAFKMYADEMQSSPELLREDELFLSTLFENNTSHILSYLQKTLEAISELSGCAAFMIAPRFDQDFVTSVKLLGIDNHRCLCAVVTDFGMVHTEVIYTPQKLSTLSLKRIEEYFKARLASRQPGTHLSKEEMRFALHTYNEVILRHVVSYSQFENEDILKAGFAKLLIHPEFQEFTAISSTLSLFENTVAMKSFFSQCFKNDTLTYWIGSELDDFLPSPSLCSLIAIPYKIHGKSIGAIALLGPSRLPYKRIFGLLEAYTSMLSQSLTSSMYANKITCRTPKSGSINTHSFTEEGKVLLYHQSKTKR